MSDESPWETPHGEIQLSEEQQNALGINDWVRAKEIGSKIVQEAKQDV